jgi:hypothetical protein
MGSSTAIIPPTTGERRHATSSPPSRPRDASSRAAATIAGWAAGTRSLRRFRLRGAIDFPRPDHGHVQERDLAGAGEELHGLLTPEEYDSAKRTTFDAFSPWPVVVSAIYEGLARLGVPSDATLVEPDCCTGNIMAAPGGMPFIGIELDSNSGLRSQMHRLADKHRKYLTAKYIGNDTATKV